MQRISMALGICRPIIERGLDESTADMLRDAVNKITQILKGEQIDEASRLSL